MGGTSWIDREMYPFASHWFELPAGRLHYLDEGKGRPIVMVHGNPAWSFLYRHLIQALRAEYRCIAPDQLGFGLSDKPRGWSYHPQDHAENLTALITGLGLRDIVLVVQDWGGPIGLSYAVTHPENVSGIVVLNTWAWPVHRDPYYLLFSGFMGGPIGRVLIRRYNFFARVIMRQVFGEKQRLSAAVHEHYLRPLAKPADRTGSYVFPGQIIGATGWLKALWGRIHALDEIPKLFVWGMKDIAFRERELRRWESTFPDARVVRLPTVGHFVQEEAPDRLEAEILPFLQQSHVA